MAPYTTLITAEQLAALQASTPPVVLDCRFDLRHVDAGAQAWRESHIPQAHYVHLDEDMAAPVSPTSGRHPLPKQSAFQHLIESLGITPESQVVVYDDASGAIAVRLWWLMRWIGHEAVALLDGGLSQWVDEGRPMASDLPRTTASHYPIHPSDDLWISTQEVHDTLDKIQLVDARDPERFRGDVEPLDTIGGHIPGAQNLPFRDNLNPDGRFRPVSELRARFEPLLSDPRPVCHSCGSGVTACHNLFAMTYAGLSPGRLYVGSWSEWIQDSDRPIITSTS